MAGWSDYADFTSADTLRLLSPLQGIKPVVEAINERRSILGWSSISDIGELSAASLNYISYAVMGMAHRFLTPELFSEGSIDLNYFNSTNILTAIGDDHLIQPILHFSADWLFQQYKILNQFTRTTGKFTPLRLSETNNVAWTAGAPEYPGYEDVISGVPEGYNNWSGCWSYFVERSGEQSWLGQNYTFGGDVGIIYYLYAGKINLRFVNEYWGNLEWSSIVRGSDLYKKFKFERSRDHKAATYHCLLYTKSDYGDEFCDFGSGFKDNSWNIAETKENMLLEEEYGTVNIPEIFNLVPGNPAEPSIPVAIPSESSVNGTEAVYHSLKILRFVCAQEHAVPGGFDFQTGS